MMSALDNNASDKGTEINLLDGLATLVRHRWFLARNIIIAAIIGIVLAFILPQKYTASTTILPPTDDDGPNFQSLIPDAALPLLQLNGSHSTSDLFIEILKSRSVREGVIDRNYFFRGDSTNLSTVFGIKSKSLCLSKLLEATRILASKQGVITVSAEMPTPQLAADVANAYVVELDRVNNEKNTSRAKNSRIYIEDQLRITEKRLIEASKALALFQQNNKAISLEDQLKVWIEQAGELKGQIISNEVELGVLLQTRKADNPMVIQKQRQLDELNQKYAELQYGGVDTTSHTNEFYIPFANVPEVGLQLAELLREVKVQETVWQLLNQQYYQAKIQEARDTPTVQVLDPAVPPETRSKPKRKLIIIVMGILGGMFSIFWIFGEEYFKYLENRPAEKSILVRIFSDLKSDYDRARKFIQRK